MTAAARSFKPRLGRRGVTALILIAAFAIVPPVLGRALPDTFTPYVGQFNLAVCFAAAALSLNILIGYAGQISLGHGAFLGVGAIASGLITANGPQVPYAVGIVVAAVIGALFAFGLGLPSLRLRGLYLAIATVAFAVTCEEWLFRWPALSGGSSGLEVPRPRFGSFEMTQHYDYASIVLLLLLGFWLIDQNLLRSKLGRAFHAIRSDETVAQSFGIDITRYKLAAFVLSGALAGVSGAMYAHQLVFVKPDTDFGFQNFSLLLVIVVVVGGLGSRVGVLVAAFLFRMLPESLTFLRQWELVVGPILLMDVVTRHPRGLGAAVRDAREHKEAKKARMEVVERIDAPMPKLPMLPAPAGVLERATILPGAPLLEVRNVSVRFGGLQALDDVSVTVPKGKIVGLIGPNGAGKTTFFNAATGLVKLQQGAVRFLGNDLTNKPPHDRVNAGIGRTFQLIGLAKDLSVMENFMLAQHQFAGYSDVSALLALPRVGRTERVLRERAEQAIAGLGFERFTNTPVQHLSHGQQRIVELGCALVTGPELLLLDEPSAGMAPAAAENLAERLRDIRDELGRTVLLIEHNIPLVLDVCDEIYVLNFGKILAHGMTDEIARSPEVLGAYFGEEEEVAV